MDLRKLKTLIDLVSESNISELEITEAEGKVRIVKASPLAAAQPVVVAQALVHRPPVIEYHGITAGAPRRSLASGSSAS
jgi:acetyl-CoA carboxylase biotin carboxyl carrier protein